MHGTASARNAARRPGSNRPAGCGAARNARPRIIRAPIRCRSCWWRAPPAVPTTRPRCRSPDRSRSPTTSAAAGRTGWTPSSGGERRQTGEDKMPKIAIRLAGAAVMLLAGLSAGAAGAVELKVVCAGAMRTALQELAPAFEKSSGHKLVIEYTLAGKVEEKIAADEA